MVISNNKKFIFIHIYKTGGNSVSSLLLPYARKREKFSQKWISRYIINRINKLLRLNDQGNKWINGIRKHATALEIKDCIGDKKFAEYFKFTIVRNPYDFLVSLYHYIKQSPNHRNYQTVNSLTFKEFIINETKNNCHLQSDFITNNDGKLIVDYVGKLEHIDYSLSHVSRKLNIPKKNIPDSNKSERNSDEMNYYDVELLEIVNKYFKKDFELLGYKQIQKI